MSREVMQQALEALEDHAKQYPHMQKGYTVDAIAALRAALAEPEQEPVAYVTGTYSGHFTVAPINPALVLTTGMALYTHPPQRKPLTDEEIDRITDQQWAQNNHKPIYAAHRAYARAIEQAHGIGEQT